MSVRLTWNGTMVRRSKEDTWRSSRRRRLCYFALDTIPITVAHFAKRTTGWWDWHTVTVAVANFTGRAAGRRNWNAEAGAVSRLVGWTWKRHTEAALIARNSPRAHGCRTTLQDILSLLTSRSLQHEPSGILVWPAAQVDSFCIGQCVRFFGSTGPEQQMPFDVKLAGLQQLPSRAGMRPPVQEHCFPGGVWTIGKQRSLCGPLGFCPAGQQMPVEVI